MILPGILKPGLSIRVMLLLKYLDSLDPFVCLGWRLKDFLIGNRAIITATQEFVFGKDSMRSVVPGVLAHAHVQV